MQADDVVVITTLRFDQPKTGGERYYYEVVEYLKKRSVSICFLSRSRFRLPVLKNYLSCNISLIVHFLTLWWGRADLRHKAVVVLEDGYDRPRQFLFNFFLKLFPLIRIVMGFQDVKHHLIHNRLMRVVDGYILRWFLASADRVCVHSQAMADEAINAYCVDSQKIQIIPMGIDSIEVGANDTVVRNDDILSLLYVGTCLPVKGIEYLLRAMPLLDTSSVMLHIVGQTDDDPTYYRKLQQIVQKEGIENIVTFHGRVEGQDLWDFFRRADIFVLPSLQETYSVVLMEAMRFALPVIATSTMAIPERVRDGNNGTLVPPQDSRALAEAINRLASNPELRKQYGENGRKMADSALSWEEVGKQYYEIIAELCGHSRRVRPPGPLRV